MGRILLIVAFDSTQTNIRFIRGENIMHSLRKRKSRGTKSASDFWAKFSLRNLNWTWIQNWISFHIFRKRKRIGSNELSYRIYISRLFNFASELSLHV